MLTDPDMDPVLDRTIREGLELADLWRALFDGRLFIAGTHHEANRSYATLEAGHHGRARPADVDAKILQRILTGEGQKAVAFELGVSAHCVGFSCTKTLRAVANGRMVSRAPLVLVMAALAAQGCPLRPLRFEHAAGDSRWVVSVEVPGQGLFRRLSPSEAEVARLAILGWTHAQVAFERETALRTVANQIAAIFRKVGVSGRAALRVEAVLDQARQFGPWNERLPPRPDFDIGVASPRTMTRIPSGSGWVGDRAPC